MIKTNALIIGAGPAGLYAAFELGLQGFQSHIVDALPFIGGQCAELFGDKLIYDIPAIKACTGNELAQRLLEQAQPFQPELHLQRLVTHIEPVTPNWANGHEDLTKPSLFKVTLDDQRVFLANCVVIASGVGAFLPKKLKLEGTEALENSPAGKQVFYHLPDDLEVFAGKRIVISGDLEQTLQTANWLAGQCQDHIKNNLHPTCVTLVHRRDQFRAEENTISTTAQLRKDGLLHFIAGQFTQLHTDKSTGILTSLSIKQSADQQLVQIPADAFFVLHGLAPQANVFTEWGLTLKSKQLPVDTATFQTNIPGIFAIGDVASYAGKRKLITSAFHEAALASYAAASYMQGDAQIPQIYTTSNPQLQEVLAVKGPMFQTLHSMKK